VGNNEGDLERSTVRNIYAIGDVLKVSCGNLLMMTIIVIIILIIIIIT